MRLPWVNLVCGGFHFEQAVYLAEIFHGSTGDVVRVAAVTNAAEEPEYSLSNAKVSAACYDSLWVRVRWNCVIIDTRWLCFVINVDQRDYFIVPSSSQNYSFIIVGVLIFLWDSWNSKLVLVCVAVDLWNHYLWLLLLASIITFTVLIIFFGDS